MKTLLAILLVVLGGLWLRSVNIREHEKAQAHAALLLADMQRTAAVEPVGPGRTVSYDPATRSYVEHASNVSVMQSRGGGGGGGAPAKPAGRTMLDQPAHR